MCEITLANLFANTYLNTWEKNCEGLVSTKNTRELPQKELKRGPIDLE